MKPDLCISFRFIQPFPLFHGRRDGELPEWPPSPMRAFQALLNAACLRERGRAIAPKLRETLRALEALRPQIIAPPASVSVVGYRAYVPHNLTDLVSAAWHRGNLDASIAEYRIEKDIRPMRIQAADEELPVLHYLYPLERVTLEPEEMVAVLRPSVRSITHLGWGIDQVAADVNLVQRSEVSDTGERWLPSELGGRPLRVPRSGTLDALLSRHERILTRLRGRQWTRVGRISVFDRVLYRRESDPVGRPYVVFRLLDDNDDMVAYPHAKLIHITGMVRHLAIETMKRNPPRNLRGRTAEEWVETYVAGHMSPDDKASGTPHAQFSYVPLPSIGHAHTDPAIRRIMVVAPVGDQAWLNHLARHLHGRLLKPMPNTRIPPGTRLELLRPFAKDGVRDAYTRASHSWASFTPVILPGHDDHKPEKTRKLILKALIQSGIDQPCEFEWSAFSRFPKSYSAHKYVRDEQARDGRRPVGYIRPDHLHNQTAVHLTIRFGRREDPSNPESPWIPLEHGVPGPLTIGAGRHCGFGLMAAIE